MTFNKNDSYYIRGLVSFGTTIVNETTFVTRCDPSHFVVFTDVAKYLPWISETAAIECEKWAFCNRYE